MRPLLKPLSTLILIVMILLLNSCDAFDNRSAKDGVLDLRNYDFDHHISLDGEWRFVWNGELSEKPGDSDGYINIEVPDSWNGYEYAGIELPSHGSGSYALTILLPEGLSEYSLEFPTAGTAYNLYVNEELVGGVGIYSTESALASPAYEPRIYDLGEHSKQIHLRIDVSNYHHRLGGLWESISFGNESDIESYRESRIAKELFLFGAIFFMGIYHLGIFSLSTRGKAALYFGVFCLIIGFRTLTTGEIFLLRMWPTLQWQTLVKIEYLSIYLGVAIFMRFIRVQFPDEINKLISQVVLGTSAIFVGLVLFTRVELFSSSLTFFQPFSLVVMIYVIYALGLALLRGEEGSSTVLIGFLAVVITFLNDMLYVANFIHTGHLISLGIMIFIFSQAFLISIRFSKAYDTIDTQRVKLERTNTAFESEIEVRKAAEQEVLQHKNHLEDLVKDRTAKLEIANEQLKELSRVDGLTGIANRRWLDEALDREWKRMLREKRPLSVVLCDIDHFKLLMIVMVTRGEMNVSFKCPRPSRIQSIVLVISQPGMVAKSFVWYFLKRTPRARLKSPKLCGKMFGVYK